MENVFKEIEPEDVCPPYIENELLAEIDFIRNVLQVVEVYTGDLFDVTGTALLLLSE